MPILILMIPSIFFVVDIQHALDLSAVLRSHGVRIYPVSSRTPKDERKRLVDMARSGEIDGLASCDCLTTGFDSPRTMLAAMARPTQSGLWYRQAIGRVLRPFPAPQGERPYQREAHVAMYRALKRGVLNQLVTLPTGTGKTAIAAQSLPMLKAWKGADYRGRLMFLVHRDELAYQTAETFTRWTSGLKIGIEKAESYAGDADVVIGSFQTLGPERSKRIEAFNPWQFDAVFSDEAHWAASSKMHQRVYHHMLIAKNEPARRDPGILHCGMTATVNRTDGVGMDRHFDEITYTYGLLDAIKDGWLCRLVGHRAETKVDISKVSMRGDDLNLTQLEETVNTPARNELVAQKYLEVCLLENMAVQYWTAPSDWVKPHAVVIDFCDTTSQHSLVSAPSLFGFAGKFNPRGRDLMQQADRVQKIKSEHPNLDLREAPDMEGIEAVLRGVDLLAPPSVPPEIIGRSKFAWLSDGPGAYRLGCMDHRVLTLRQNLLGQWEIREHSVGVSNHLCNANYFKEALQLAEKSIPAHEKQILHAGAAWREDPPSERQAQAVWNLDRRIQAEYGTAKQYHSHCMSQHRSGDRRFSKGGLAQMIAALDPLKSKAGHAD